MKQQIHLSTIKLLQRLSSLVWKVFKYCSHLSLTATPPPNPLQRGIITTSPPQEGGGGRSVFYLTPFKPLFLILTLLFVLGAGESWGQRMWIETKNQPAAPSQTNGCNGANFGFYEKIYADDGNTVIWDCRTIIALDRLGVGGVGGNGWDNDNPIITNANSGNNAIFFYNGEYLGTPNGVYTTGGLVGNNIGNVNYVNMPFALASSSNPNQIRNLDNGAIYKFSGGTWVQLKEDRKIDKNVNQLSKGSDSLYLIANGNQLWKGSLDGKFRYTGISGVDKLARVASNIGCAFSTNDGTIWREDPRTKKWTKFASKPPLSEGNRGRQRMVRNIIEITTDGLNCTYVVGNGGVYFSYDNGTTWISLNGNTTIGDTEYFKRTFAIDISYFPFTGNIMLMTLENGIFTTYYRALPLVPQITSFTTKINNNITFNNEILTINGKNLIGVTRVNIGNTIINANDFISSNATSISFTIPFSLSAGTYPISVTTNGGEMTATAPITLTVIKPYIKINSPVTNDRFYKGDKATIKFETNYNVGKFRIDLLNNNLQVETLTDTLSPNRDFIWQIDPTKYLTSAAYTIRITSTTNETVTAVSSPFSISERPPSITSFSPKEGYPGDSVLILGKNFSLFENKVLFGTVEAKLLLPPSTDSLWVAVPDFARGEVNIGVTANNQTALSKDKFRVITPFIQVLNPRQGDRRFKGDSLTLVYRHNLKGNMRIELLNGGLPVDILTNSTEPNGRFAWTIPADGFASSFTYRFRVSSVINPSISGTSGTISITEPVPVIESVSPLEVGAGDTLTITGRNLSLNTSANLVRIGGVIAEPVALPQILQADRPPLVQIKVRIPDRLIGRLSGTITVNGENPTPFKSQINVLPPFIEVTAPNGGERLVKGNLYEITWKDNLPGAVRIELLFAGTSPRPITNSTPSNGKFLWQVPVTDEIPEGNFYKIKITSLENLLVSGTSKENFFISEAPVTILDFRPKAAPKGAIVSIQGTNFKRDSPAQPLRVKFGDFSVPVEDIEYVSPNLIRAIVPESVNFDSAQISLSTAGVSLLTKDFFKIVPPFIRLLRPRGGESFDKGVETPIVYESNIGERVRIELLRGDRLIDVIRERVESTNSFNWFVPLTLRAGTDYRLRITSTRQANIFALSNPFTILPTDLQPPTIFNASFENFFTKGSRTSLSLQIQARDQDEEGSIRSVVCFYKGITQTNFKQATCAASDINFTANIPESEFDEIGLEYYFVATDMSGKTDRFPRIGTNQTYLRFADTGLPINYTAFGSEVLNYEILSIPLVLEKNTVADVFSTTLGSYNPRRWRMFQLKDNDTTYTEMSDVSTLDLGRGYWLIAKNETEIYTGVGRNFPANSNSPFILKTQKGANLIGNPYNFDLDWEKVVAFNRGRGVPELFVFEGGTWKKSNVLKKFRGGFIFNAFGAVDIAFPVSAKVGSSGRTEREVPNPIDKPNWEVQLNLQAGNYRNELGGFGMNEKASLGIDVFDRQPIPQLLANLATMFNNQLSINNEQQFQTNSNDFKPLHINLYLTKDVVPSKANFIWHFSVQSTFEGVQTLSWENDYFGQNGKQLFLYDQKAKRLTDMRKIQSYSFEGERNFKIFFGDKNFINNELPELKASVFVYPNPFADDLHLSINVPENETSIMFRIYDVAGKLMRLENKGNLRAGVHEIILEGKDNFGIPLKSGAYLLQIHIGQSIEAWKIMKE